MAHELFRLADRIFNKPQFVSLPTMQMVADVIFARNVGETSLALMPEDRKPADEPKKTYSYSQLDKVGLVEVKGVLTDVKFEAYCGEQNCSYEQLQEDFATMIKLGAETIVMEVDSGGGSAYGCWEGALACKAMAQEAGVKLVAYVNGVAFSAAYAWTSIADEIVVNPMGEVGSIGVVVQLYNTNRLEKEKGIDRVYLYAGKNKIPFDKNGDFTASFLSGIQEKIDVFYEDFVEFVTEMRGIDSQVVRDTEAGTFLPEKALALGLIDKVMTKNDFISYVFKRNN